MLQLAFYSASERGAGLARLFEEFDVIPTYLSRKELKSIAQLVLASQVRANYTTFNMISATSRYCHRVDAIRCIGAVGGTCCCLYEQQRR